jgi:hypothetical protein
MLPKYQRRFAIMVTVFSLSACAPEVPVQQAGLLTTVHQNSATARFIQQDVTVHLASGYERHIAAQSRWRSVGELPQGEVFRPIDTVFTIEGRQIHEAWLVVADNELVGFYLPGESHFSPLDKPISIVLGDRE